MKSGKGSFSDFSKRDGFRNSITTPVRLSFHTSTAFVWMTGLCWTLIILHLTLIRVVGIGQEVTFLDVAASAGIQF